MTYSHKLKYAGSEPFAPERDRLPHEAMELLEQDKTYQRLAEVRYLADALESRLADYQSFAEQLAGDVLFDAIATTDAPLQVAVAIYVYEWLRAHEEGDAAAYADELPDDYLDTVDICLYCYEPYRECKCPERAEVA